MCEQQQEDELGALIAVYPDILTVGTVPGGREIKLDVGIELEEEREIEIVSSVVADEVVRTRVGYLPPLVVTVHLPPTYPQTEPTIESVHAKHAWLGPSLVHQLVERLGRMWTGEGVLWQWVEEIRTGAFLAGVVQLPHPSPPALVAHLAGHAQAVREARFSAQAYACGICLSPRRGAKCVRLPCGHVCCAECLGAFWGLCVAEGDVGRVGCAEGCTGETAEWEDAIRRVLSEEEVKRWRWLRVKQAVERDPTTVRCPLQMCQAPVPRPPGEDESGWARLRTCEACGYAFCVGCRRTWHGPVSRCVVTRTAEFVEAYMAMDEGDQRRELEMRFGRKNLQRMVAEFEQERDNAAWIKAHTMACPGCNASVEKNQGCNHMTCVRCKTHFCFRCGAKLRAESPFKHFDQPGGCYQKLFEGES